MSNPFNIKTYLEENMGFKTVACSRNRQSVVYRMKHQEGFEMTYELLGNGGMQFTIDDETRTLPSSEELARVLPHEPDEVVVCRLVSQIVSKMLDNRRDQQHLAIRDKFNRHANKH